jgi:undecaprenyl-diphosphatase
VGVNWFDSTVMQFFNQMSQQSWRFDYTILSLSENQLIKGGCMAAIFWWLWFLKDENQVNTREHIIATIFGSFTAILSARILMLALPYRVRPMHDASLDFLWPFGVEENSYANMSSFPSDHAVFFFAVVTGLATAKRKLGIPLFIFTIFLILLPRIYLGLHYPSDIVVGSILGVGIGILVNSKNVRRRIAPPIFRLEEKSASVFYTVFFLLTYQIADMFDSGRAMIRYLITMF